MKRFVSLLLSAALMLALLPACQGPAVESTSPASSPPEEAGLSCTQVLSHVWDTLGIELTAAEVYGFGSADDQEQMAFYIKGAYGLEESEWEDAGIARETGASAVEMAVLRFADEDAAKHGYDCLKDYLHAREGDFTGYAPAQAELVADAALVNEGRYVGLFIVEGSEYAGGTFTDLIQTGKLPEPTPAPNLDGVDELLAALVDRCARWDDVSDLEWLGSGNPDALEAHLTDVYGLSRGQWSEAAVAMGKGDSVFEIAVLRVADDQKPWEVIDVLVQDYLDVKEEKYAPFPAQAALLSEAVAGNPIDTSFVILAVCSKPEGTLTTAVQLLGTNGYSTTERHFNESKPAVDQDQDYANRVKFVQPNKDDMSLYDTSAILAAWEAGNPSGLSSYDRDIYDAAQAVLGQVLEDGMSGLEKETAIYGWVVNNVDYDWTHQDIMATTPRESYTPYGGLVNHTAVCLGYAMTFQLLCDLAGVECITVVGAAFNSEEDHAWNMVRLDGEWYCVDVTWDANYREQVASDWPAEYWNHFNVTSDEMAAENHQWDYANTPEATATDHGRG